ncbi:hypothetical protein EUFG_02313 [Escherichia coli O104:H4 str. 11-3677]|nr:hypothetical protein EUFG_02313 [Escherichia coli O104:H4 str. 11-3677]
MAEYDRCHRAVLSQGGQWPTALSAGDHAAYSLHAALVQPGSDGAMEDALYEIALHCACFARLSLDSALAGSHHHHEFPPPARAASTGPSNCSRPSIAGWPKQASMMTQGTLVDATIIEAPSSTKNKEQQRDPEMHQTKKGNSVALWHEGPHWCRCQRVA